MGSAAGNQDHVVSHSRNHRRTRRIREFAERTGGFTYQQALHYLDHFAKWTEGPDAHGDVYRVILCSEIRVGDRVFHESSNVTWSTDDTCVVTSVSHNGEHNSVEVVTIDGDRFDFTPHAQIIVLRLGPCTDEGAPEYGESGMRVLRGPRMMNAHLHINSAADASSVLREVTSKPITARPEPTLRIRWTDMHPRLLSRGKPRQPDSPPSATGSPLLADVVRDAEIAADRIDADQAITPNADYIDVWVPDSAVVIDLDKNLAVDLDSDVSHAPAPGYMNRIATLYSPAMGYRYHLSVFGPERKWRRQDRVLEWQRRLTTRVVDPREEREFLLISGVDNFTTPDGQPSETFTWDIPHPLPWW